MEMFDILNIFVNIKERTKQQFHCININNHLSARKTFKYHLTFAEKD